MAESNHPDIHMPSPRYATKKRNTCFLKLKHSFAEKKYLT